MARELSKMGVNVKEGEDRLEVFHAGDLRGIDINHEDDHRIAMACCIAALQANKPSILKKIEIIQDSYPTFITHLKSLGAEIEFI